MSYYQEEMCRTLTQRAGDWLQCKYWPRTTALIVLGMSVACLYFSSLLAFACGVEYLPLRFAISTFCGYLMYLLLLGLWMRVFTSIEAKDLLIKEATLKSTDVAGESEFDERLNNVAQEALRESTRRAENLVGFVVILCLFGVFFISCHFVYHAPWYLAQLLVQSGKIRHRAVPTGSMFDSLVLPLWQSWPAAILLLLHSASLGLAIKIILENR
jgi:hypothetical protein